MCFTMSRNRIVKGSLTHGIDFWLFQELTEYSPTIALDSANVAWILPQNEGEGDADADALQIRRLIDAQVNAVLSLEARGWLPEKIGLHESPYDMAADNIISGESPEIVSNLDQLELPFKAMMILDATIRAGFPEFIQDVYL